MAEELNAGMAQNFIHDFIDEDIAQGGQYAGKQVHTRFPPEPNGYLHIGHAKAIFVDFGTAEKYGGICNLRMDDTNPTKEDEEFVDAIQEDIHWLGFDWGDRFFYGSDYFEEDYRQAELLIRKGLAYVCQLTPEEFKEYRGGVGIPARSPYRDRPIDLSDMRGAYQVLREHPSIPALLEGNGQSWLTQINDRVREIYEFLHTELYPVCPLEELLGGRVYQFVPFVTPGEEGMFLEVMPGCTHTRWHPKGIDLLPRDGGKGVGVRLTMERYGFAPEEVMAFGDGDNDMPMLEAAGLSVAMGNGDQAVKDMADYVTGTVEEDGVSQALRHFGLLP